MNISVTFIDISPFLRYKYKKKREQYEYLLRCLYHSKHEIGASADKIDLKL